MGEHSSTSHSTCNTAYGVSETNPLSSMDRYECVIMLCEASSFAYRKIGLVCTCVMCTKYRCGPVSIHSQITQTITQSVNENWIFSQSGRGEPAFIVDIHCNRRVDFCCQNMTAKPTAHRRSQDFVWGCTVSYQKSWRPFLVVALKERLNTPPDLTRPAKTVVKIDSCSGWGCTSCPSGGCTYTFSL